MYIDAGHVDPFTNVDLSTVDDATVQAMQTMREAAEDAETEQFDPAIDAASGDEGRLSLQIAICPSAR